MSRSDVDAFNYQLGVVYKPASTASTPTSAPLRAPVARLWATAAMTPTTTTDALISLKPVRDRPPGRAPAAPAGQKLNLTAAVFRNEVTNVRISDATGTYMGGNKSSMASNWASTGQIRPTMSQVLVPYG